MSSVQVTAPYDQGVLTELAVTSLEEGKEALGRAFEIYEHRGRWLSAEQRREILKRLENLVREQKDKLALQAAEEGGKPLKDSLVELDRACSGIQIAREAIVRLTGEEVPMDQGPSSENRTATTFREPRGVVLAISAFNHPFNLLIHQVVTAIAAGCPVVIKPASATPLSCVSLMKLLAESGLPRDFCQMILTKNDDTSELVSDERVGFLSFIGSSDVGWMLRSRLARGAACTLEHGGVAPVILDETADLEDAIPLLTKGAFYHAGQVCVSVQRIYAHVSMIAELSEKMVAAAQRLTVGDPTEDTTDVGPLIWPKEVDRVDDWVLAAKSAGAKILCGGRRLSSTLYAPTILLNPPDDALVSTKEIFGPVVCLYAYDDMEEALDRANLKDSYFQASLFTNRLDRALDVGRRLHGTSVMVNDHTAFRVDWMPFGGHRDSGLGLGGIEQSMHDMTLQRMIVFRQPLPQG